MFEPYVEAQDYDDSDYDAAFPGRRSLRGLRQLTYDFQKVFVEQVTGQHRDISAILERFPADVTLGDTAMIGPFTVNETGGPPNAVYNITCLGLPGRGLAPFGLGLLPDDTRKGLVRNRILAYSAANIVFGRVSHELERQCRVIGVEPRKFTGPAVSDYLYLQPSVPSFEYRRPDLPPQVHYVGALLPPPGAPRAARVVARGRVVHPAGGPRHPGHRRDRSPRPRRPDPARVGRRTSSSSLPASPTSPRWASRTSPGTPARRHTCPSPP